MISLDKDLQNPKVSFESFGIITSRILGYLPNILSGFQDKNNYRIYSSEIAGTKKYIRPLNRTLFIEKESEFSEKFDELKTIFTEIGISNKRLVLQIPYETDEGEKTYKCENDLILSPYEQVKSDTSSIDPKEIVVSIKTTSKDRMGKMFIDKILLERFVGHPQKVIGIFLNDVQRKESNNISFTLVSGLFMVYTKFLTELNGIYYLDPPPNANKKPYSNYMKPFSELITKDINSLLST